MSSKRLSRRVLALSSRPTATATCAACPKLWNGTSGEYASSASRRNATADAAGMSKRATSPRSWSRKRSSRRCSAGGAEATSKPQSARRERSAAAAAASAATRAGSSSSSGKKAHAETRLPPLAVAVAAAGPSLPPRGVWGAIPADGAKPAEEGGCRRCSRAGARCMGAPAAAAVSGAAA